VVILALAGYRNTNGGFNNRDTNTNFWSSTQNNASNAWNRNLNLSNVTVNRNNNNKANGFSVRCVKDWFVMGAELISAPFVLNFQSSAFPPDSKAKLFPPVPLWRNGIPQSSAFLSKPSFSATSLCAVFLYSL
jgi:hypothetical protein